MALCNLARSPRLRGKRLHKPSRLSHSPVLHARSRICLFLSMGIVCIGREGRYVPLPAPDHSAAGCRKGNSADRTGCQLRLTRIMRGRNGVASAAPVDQGSSRNPQTFERAVSILMPLIMPRSGRKSRPADRPPRCANVKCLRSINLRRGSNIIPPPRFRPVLALESSSLPTQA